MIWHVVLFKLYPNAADSEIQAMIQGLKQLSHLIPEVLRMEVGLNYSERSRGHQVMAVSSFRSGKDLASYTIHPEHIRVVQTLIDPIRESVTVGDIEV